jgi:hypothetical protein
MRFSNACSKRAHQFAFGGVEQFVVDIWLVCVVKNTLMPGQF